MNNEEQQESLSPEEFRVRVLKSRFAEKLAQAEDEIATLITQLTGTRQELEGYKQREGVDAQETEGTPSDEG